MFIVNSFPHRILTGSGKRRKGVVFEIDRSPAASLQRLYRRKNGKQQYHRSQPAIPALTAFRRSPGEGVRESALQETPPRIGFCFDQSSLLILPREVKKSIESGLQKKEGDRILAQFQNRKTGSSLFERNLMNLSQVLNHCK
jgi:hypothetical protein